MAWQVFTNTSGAETAMSNAFRYKAVAEEELEKLINDNAGMVFELRKVDGRKFRGRLA